MGLNKPLLFLQCTGQWYLLNHKYGFKQTTLFLQCTVNAEEDMVSSKSLSGQVNERFTVQCSFPIHS